MKSRYILLFYVSSLLSCSVEEKEDSEAIPLTGTTLGLDTLLSLPIIIEVNSSALALTDEAALIDENIDSITNNNKTVHFFSLDSFSYIGSGAVAGEGPGEVTMPWMIDVKQDSFWVFDLGNYIMLNCYPPKASPRYHSLKEAAGVIYYTTWVNDSTVVSPTFTRDRLAYAY